MNNNTFDGSPCRICGNTTRYINKNICISCKKEHNKRRYIIHEYKINNYLLTKKWGTNELQ